MLLCAIVRLANDDFGKLVLRLTVAGLLLFHGVAKLGKGVGGIESLLEGKGLPGFLAYGVYIGEVVAPVLVLAGWKTRLWALVMAVNMIVAIALSHPADILALSQTGGWAIELQGLFLFGSLAIALLGAGRYSVTGGRGSLD